MGEQTQTSGDGEMEKPRPPVWLRKTLTVLGFAWWIVKVVIWFIRPNPWPLRLEFPKYDGSRDLGDGGVQTLGISDKDTGSSSK